MPSRRPREDVLNKGHKIASFSYHLILGLARQQVYFKAFLSVFSISEKRVRRILHISYL